MVDIGKFGTEVGSSVGNPAVEFKGLKFKV